MGLREAIQMSNLLYLVGSLFVSLLIVLFSGDGRERKRIKREGFVVGKKGDIRPPVNGGMEC